MTITNRPARRKLSQHERREVYQKTNGHCAYCGIELAYKNVVVDHVIALHRGGTDELSNMLPACRSWNHYKNTLTLESFRKSVERFPTVLMRDSVTYKNAVRFGLVIPNAKKVVFYFEKQLEI